MTLAALVLCASVALGFVVARWLPSEADVSAIETTIVADTGEGAIDARTRPRSEALPSVSAAPRVRASDGATAMAPASLLLNLPVDQREYAERLHVGSEFDPSTSPRFFEYVEPGDEAVGLPLPLRIEYTFDVELTESILRILRRARVERGHVIVLDPRSGRLIAYVSTDTDKLPPTHPYPAASLVKVITAAAALDLSPERARRPCLYRGNPYRLSARSVRRPSRGHSASLERALAMSNNKCFAQLAVEAVGSEALLDTLDRFGWTSAPAPGHLPGTVERGEGDYDLGRLGCGLSGCRITPMHAAQLAGILATGLKREPWWIDRVVDASGRTLALPEAKPPTRVMSDELATEMRKMLVRTTTRGTAKSAFRDRRGRSKLGSVTVAGKTGNLSGSAPVGRYEWFMGVAPADEPTIAVAVLQAQGHLWWAKSSQVGADVLQAVFCERSRCDAEYAHRFTGDLRDATVPVFLSDEIRREITRRD